MLRVKRQEVRHEVAVTLFCAFPSSCFGLRRYAAGAIGSSTIQDAINAALPGDVIVVKSGIYTENIDFLGKAVVVHSKYGPAHTIIDGGLAGPVISFTNGEGADTVLDGFSLTNGDGAVVSSYTGGAIHCDGASPLLTNNIIFGNFAVHGAGIHARNSADPVISNNTIYSNLSSGSLAGGGGIFVESSAPLIVNNTVFGNTADYGGGIKCHNRSSVVIANTIVWGNTASTGRELFIGSTPDPSVVSISYSDVEGGLSSSYVASGCTLNWGAGMIDEDPLFVEPAVGDFHLTFDSLCKNAGDNGSVPADLLGDFEKDPRIHDGCVDMGADEFHTHLYHNGTVIPGSPFSFRVIGPPNTTPVKLAIGYDILNQPVPTKYGDLFINIKKMLIIGSVAANGSLIFDVTAPTHWVPGAEFPFQAKVGPGWDPDTVLTNLLVLTPR